MLFCRLYFYHLLFTQPICMNCHYRNVNKLRRGQRFTNLASLSSLVFLSCVSSDNKCLSSLVAWFKITGKINFQVVIWGNMVLCTVRLLITVVQGTLTMYTKLEWLVNRILPFSQSAHVTYVAYICRLLSSVRLALAHQNCSKQYSEISLSTM